MRLDLHALLRSHKNLFAVHMRGEMYSLLRNPAQAGKRKHLKAAAIREDRPIPVKKLVDAAHIVDHVVPRTDMQVIGIGKLDLTAHVI